MGGPGFTWGYCWATRMAGLVLGELSGLLLVLSVSGRFCGNPAAAVCCNNTHGKKSEHHSHAGTFPPSAVGVTLLQAGTAVVIRVVGSGDRIEHPADGVRHRNRLVLGVNL